MIRWRILRKNRVNHIALRKVRVKRSHMVVSISFWLISHMIYFSFFLFIKILSNSLN